MVKKPDASLLAAELRVVLGRLVRRLRAEHPFPLSYLSVLGRLDREGPQSVSALAGAEHVRHQSMTQTVGELESDGLVQRRPDSSDRRRALVELTASGLQTLQAERRGREGWLADTISQLSTEEGTVLRQAIELLGRLAEK